VDARPRRFLQASPAAVSARPHAVHPPRGGTGMSRVVVGGTTSFGFESGGPVV